MRKGLLFAAVLAFGCPAACWAESNPAPSIFIKNKSPAVSFEVYEPGPDGRLVMPARTPPFQSYFDEDGVYATRVGGRVARHIATISGQASGMSNNDLRIEEALQREPSLTPAETAALRWLEQNKIELQGAAVVWHYTFDHTFNNIVVKAGWPSAFAQADIIKALILAYRKTSDQSYLDLATRAGYAFTVPCERGGLRCEVGGIPWFEEIPVPYGYAPMILNGHLYSVVMLYRLHELTDDQRIEAAYREGLASAKAMLLRYDTGYWSIYQLRPRELNTLLVIAPATEQTEIQDVSISSPVSTQSVLALHNGTRSTYDGNRVWGDGWGLASGSGRELTGLGMINLLPGRLTIDHDPVHIASMNVSVHYRSRDCTPPTVATYDYRARSKGFMKIVPTDYGRNEQGCELHLFLRNAVNQWSQIDAFYHDWHTRLVTELWRITGDPKFYATAVRWGRYAAAERELKTEETKATIAIPIFAPSESPEDDAAIMQALGGADPATLSRDKVIDALRAWFGTHCVGPKRVADIITRAGLHSEAIKLAAC